MKTNRAGFWIAASLVFMFFTSGCPPKATPPEEAKAPEISITKPLPREALADSPDLYAAKLVITDAGLERMQKEGVPADVTGGLSGLKGREFGNAKEFLDAVSQAVGADALNANKDTIVRNALVVELPATPAFPGESLMLAGPSDFQTIYFDFDKYNIKPEFEAAIRHNAEILTGDPGKRVLIEGHCDERGTTEYNLALGERRARAVQNALVEQGVNPNQISIVSHGEERPADPGHNEEAWAKNRRAMFNDQ